MQNPCIYAKRSYSINKTGGAQVAVTSLFNDKVQDDSRDKSFRMIQLTADMGAPKEIIVPMLDLAMGGKLKKEHQAFLLAPIIQHASPWRDTTPDWMYKAITADRLKIVIDEIKTGNIGWRVGHAEIACVMYPATLDAPMRHIPAQIYLWTSANAIAKDRNMSVDSVWEMTGVRKIEDKELESNGEYHYEYKELCQSIRRKVVNEGLRRVREIKKQDRSNDNQPPAQDKNKPPPPTQGIQLDLF